MLERRGDERDGADAGLAAPTFGAAGQQSAKAAATLPYQDASVPVWKRVDDLLSRMTLAEKIGQMTPAERANVDADTSKITSDNLEGFGEVFGPRWAFDPGDDNVKRPVKDMQLSAPTRPPSTRCARRSSAARW